jgi:flagellar hook protein FlgE
MSLTSAMYTGVSGLLANSQAMNVIGNNISNVNTVGYKDGRTLFSDMLSQSVGQHAQVGNGVQVQSVQNFYTQGSTQTTGNVTDLSIQGNTLFAVMAPGNTPATQDAAFLTRAGSFTVDNNNNLVNPDGYQVLGTDGKPIQFQSTPATPSTDFGKITSIDNKGAITYLAADGVTQYFYNGNGAAGLAINAGPPAVQVAVVKAADPSVLQKVGGNLYQATPESGVPNAGFASATANGISEKIVSNSLEQSNVDMATEFVNMIVTQRAYSANSKTITTTDQMTQEVLGLIR